MAGARASEALIHAWRLNSSVVFVIVNVVVIVYVIILGVVVIVLMS